MEPLDGVNLLVIFLVVVRVFSLGKIALGVHVCDAVVVNVEGELNLKHSQGLDTRGEGHHNKQQLICHVGGKRAPGTPASTATVGILCLAKGSKSSSWPFSMSLSMAFGVV